MPGIFNKNFLYGILSGALGVAVVAGGIGIAIGHPIPHIYKKVADKQIKPTGPAWVITPSGSTAPAALSVSQAKQIADVVKGNAFSMNGSVLTVAIDKPSAAEISDASGQFYYGRL